MPVQFKTDRSRVVVKDHGVDFHGTWSKETEQFVKNRFVVLRKFIPQDIIDICLDSWKTFEHDPRLMDVTFEKEREPIPNTPEQSLNTSAGSYCFPPAVGLHAWLKRELQKVLDFRIRETYSYSRKYTRGAYLRAHTDRPSCEVSATICLDYKSDDGTPWSIWVQNDRNYLLEADSQDHIYEVSQKYSHKDRKKNGAKKVDLEVGDVLLYQGPNIPHWRDEFLGDYSYHMFLHFYNATGQIHRLDGGMKRPHTHAKNLERCVLEWDGRNNRYERNEEDPNFKKDLTEWMTKVWNPTKAEEKIMCVNNFEDYEVKEK